MSSESDGADLDSRFNMNDQKRGSEKGTIIEESVKKEENEAI